MTVNLKVALLLLGLVVGGAAGYLTRPQSAEIKIGQMHVEFDNNQMSSNASNGLTSGQTQHIMVFAAVGGVIGLLIGFALDRRA